MAPSLSRLFSDVENDTAICHDANRDDAARQAAAAALAPKLKRMRVTGDDHSVRRTRRGPGAATVKPRFVAPKTSASLMSASASASASASPLDHVTGNGFSSFDALFASASARVVSFPAAERPVSSVARSAQATADDAAVASLASELRGRTQGKKKGKQQKKKQKKKNSRSAKSAPMEDVFCACHLRPRPKTDDAAKQRPAPLPQLTKNEKDFHMPSDMCMKRLWTQGYALLRPNEALEVFKQVYADSLPGNARCATCDKCPRLVHSALQTLLYTFADREACVFSTDTAGLTREGVHEMLAPLLMPLEPTIIDRIVTRFTDCAQSAAQLRFSVPDVNEDTGKRKQWVTLRGNVACAILGKRAEVLLQFLGLPFRPGSAELRYAAKLASKAHDILGSITRIFGIWKRQSNRLLLAGVGMSIKDVHTIKELQSCAVLRTLMAWLNALVPGMRAMIEAAKAVTKQLLTTELTVRSIRNCYWGHHLAKRDVVDALVGAVYGMRYDPVAQVYVETDDTEDCFSSCYISSIYFGSHKKEGDVVRSESIHSDINNVPFSRSGAAWLNAFNGGKLQLHDLGIDLDPIDGSLAAFAADRLMHDVTAVQHGRRQSIITFFDRYADDIICCGSDVLTTREGFSSGKSAIDPKYALPVSIADAARGVGLSRYNSNE